MRNRGSRAQVNAARQALKKLDQVSKRDRAETPAYLAANKKAAKALDKVSGWQEIRIRGEIPK